MKSMKKIGVLSDTHGLIRPEVAEMLAGCDLIIHAGDMDDAQTLGALGSIGPPCRIVWGNCDYGAWAEGLPPFELFEFAGNHFYVRHIPWQIDIDPVAAGVDVVITGHTHSAEIRHEDHVLFLNPGSAGPSSGKKPATAAIISLEGVDIKPELIIFR